MEIVLLRPIRKLAIPFKRREGKKTVNIIEKSTATVARK